MTSIRMARTVVAGPQQSEALSPELAPGETVERSNTRQKRREIIGTEWLGLKEVTQYAAVSERTVRAWIHASINALPAVRVGGKLLVRRSELDAWLGRHRVKPLDAIDLDGIVRGVLQGLAHGG